MSNVTCVECHGEKKILGLFPVYSAGFTGDRKPAAEIDCPRCFGTGAMPAIHLEWMKAGLELREDRLSRRLGLREEAERRGMKPSELSRMEQGRVEPVLAETPARR